MLGWTGLFLLTTISARAEVTSDWMHISRRFQDATVSLDYRVQCYTYSMGTACTAKPVWINVYGPSADSAVRAVFMNTCSDGTRETREIDLNYAENKFTGDLPYGTKTRIDGCRQELAVVINGVWSTQYNYGRNFNLDLMNGR